MSDDATYVSSHGLGKQPDLLANSSPSSSSRGRSDLSPEAFHVVVFVAFVVVMAVGGDAVVVCGSGRVEKVGMDTIVCLAVFVVQRWRHSMRAEVELVRCAMRTPRAAFCIPWRC